MIKKFKVGQNQHQKIEINQPGRWEVVLSGTGAEVEVVGVFDAQGREKIDLEVIIHHRAPHTRATVTLKGVVRDQAQLKFLGRIIIDEKCGDTNSFLTERILLLSDQARAEAIPELEILSDDVKCTHAASISCLDESQLFYLMSRGVSRAEAEEMLVEGFLSI